MDAITVDSFDFPAENNSKETDIQETHDKAAQMEKREPLAKTKKKGKVIQRNYTLNDTGALRKKLKWETSRKVDFAVAKEAKIGCNISLHMKSSFFEMVKEFFIPDLEEMDDILSIDNAEAAKAGTEGFGDAFVEYSMEISFKVENNEHTIKI